MSSGPAIRSAGWVTEGSLGFALFTDEVVYDIDNGQVRHYFANIGAELFGTNTRTEGRSDWTLGVRATLTLPGGILGFYYDGVRRRPTGSAAGYVTPPPFAGARRVPDGCVAGHVR